MSTLLNNKLINIQNLILQVSGKNTGPGHVLRGFCLFDFLLNVDG